MHTRGPYLRSGNTVYALNAQGTNRMSALVQGGFAEQHRLSSVYITDAEVEDTATLFQAACTSYDKHCGERAVECAEADLLGQALEALERTKPWLTSYPGGGAIPVYDQVCAVLALSKGEK